MAVINKKITSLGRVLLTIFVIFNVVGYRKMMVRCAYQDRVTIATENDPDVLQQKWRNMEDVFMSASESMVRKVLPALVRMSSEVDVSNECTAAVLKTLSALKDGKNWAYNLFDATGKPMGGQMMGTSSFYGSYHLCLNTTVPNAWNPDKEDFRGKYCLARFRVPLPPKPKLFTYGQELPGLHNLTLKTEIMTSLKQKAPIFYSFGFQVGLCLPSVCTNDDITEITNSIAGHIGWNGELYSCETKMDETPLARDQIAVLFFSSLLIGIAIVATTMETAGRMFRKHFHYDKYLTSWKIVRAFSIRRNTKKIFDVSTEHEDTSLSALNGMRFLSIGWVIVIHVYSQLSPFLYREGFRADNIAKTFSFQIITSGSLSVDTFFFITGVLVANQIVSLVDKKGKKYFNVPIIIARRLYRLLPSAMMTLGLVVVLPLMNSGPVWNNETGALVKATRKNWWSVLACVSNFLPFHEMPLVSIWYIAADIQLFLMAMVILTILFKHEAASYALMAGLAVGSVMASGLVIYCTENLPVFMLTAPDKEIVFDQFYHGHTLPHNHISVYIIGMVLGIYFVRSGKPTIPTWAVVVGWPVALLLMFTALFSGHAFTDGGIPNALESFFFAASYRSLWALGLAIMTLLCATRNGGFVNAFLSWKAYVPLNRLTYLAYLLHILFITYFHGSLRGVVDLSDHFNVWISVGTLGLTFVGAYFMKILFEAPLAELEKIFLERLLSSKSQSTTSHVVVLPAIATIAVPHINLNTQTTLKV